MSEKLRKTIGAGLLVLAALLICAGIFPAGRNETESYTARGFAEESVTKLPALAADDPVNIGNSATLERLPGIGPATAEAMLTEREENGPFIYPEDLISVYGIGEGKLKQIRDELTVVSGESEE